MNHSLVLLTTKVTSVSYTNNKDSKHINENWYYNNFMMDIYESEFFKVLLDLPFHNLLLYTYAFSLNWFVLLTFLKQTLPGKEYYMHVIKFTETD